MPTSSRRSSERSADVSDGRSPSSPSSSPRKRIQFAANPPPRSSRRKSTTSEGEKEHRRRRPPDRPVHLAQDSLFSSSSGYTNYKGYLNLALLLLGMACSRVALENLIRYGILIEPFQWIGIFFNRPFRVPNLALWVIVNVFILAALNIERALVAKRMSNRTGVILYIFLLCMQLLLPVVSCLLLHTHPVPSSITLGLYVCVFLKLISFAHVNWWCRQAFVDEDDDEDIHVNEVAHGTGDTVVTYPHNLTVGNIYYFIVAPTLCYELNFPRSPSIRRRFVAKRAVEVVVLAVCIISLAQQWIVPIVRNSVRPLIDMDVGLMIERLLKLAIPNHIIWQLSFYVLFHSMLNLNAELLRFADRAFYRDWWNSTTMTYFWSNWNIPVHRFALRHVYKPLLRHGFKSSQAAIVVFTLSAFFHEYLVSVPLRMFRLWAFAGMLAQVPLGMLTKNIDPLTGNVIVWMSLLMGQPLCVLMYFHDWYLMTYTLNPGDPLPLTDEVLAPLIG